MTLWSQVGAFVADNEDGEVLTAEGLEVRTGLLSDRPCVLIRLPIPERVLECFYIAAILETAPTTDQIAGRAPLPKLRYFTLELGWTLMGSRRTVLCEWQRDGHLNYGDGPEPEQTQFLAAVVETLGCEKSS